MKKRMNEKKKKKYFVHTRPPTTTHSFSCRVFTGDFTGHIMTLIFFAIIFYGKAYISMKSIF